VLKKEATLY